ncbi:MAG: hypothetical protein ACXWQO_11525 [Bdellovibrionota bacterium]
MKLSLLVIPVLVLMSCGQLLPSKKNPYSMKSSSVTVGACSTFQPGFNTGGANISGFSACTSVDASTVVIRNGAGSSSGMLCAYPSNDTAANIPLAKCFAPSPSGGDTVMSWPGTSFNSVILILQQDKAAYETVAMSFGASAPYSIARIR